MDDLINTRQASPDAPAPVKRRAWFKRILIGVLLVVVVGFCIVIWFIHRTRSTPPYSTALELVCSAPEVIEHLGQPVRDVRWLPSGPYPEQFNIRIRGPEGEADVTVRAGKFEGEWGLTSVDVVTLGSGLRFSLDTGTVVGEAPAWPPAGGESEASGGSELNLDPPKGIEVDLPDDGPPGVNIELPPPDLEIQMPEVPSDPES